MHYLIYQTDDAAKAEAWLNEQHKAGRKLHTMNTHGGAMDAGLKLVLNPAITLITVPMNRQEKANAGLAEG